MVVGALLAIFGLQWLRKAVLRATGYKALHDEASAYLREVAAAEAAPTETKRGVNDWYAFTLAFKGVLLEGLEVVFIVITFGANQKNVGAAVIGAAAAIVAGHRGRHRAQGPAYQGARELDEVRGGRHAHLVRHLLGRRGRGRQRWPGNDAALLVLVPVVARRLPRLRLLAALPQDGRHCFRPGIGGCQLMKQLKAFGAFWYDFIVGDDWHVAALVVAGLALTAILTHAAKVNAWWLLPVFVFAALAWSLHRATARK